MDQTAVDYRRVFTDFIKKQIVIFGPDITFTTIKEIFGIHVEKDGTVTRIEGDPKVLFERLLLPFMTLSSIAVEKVLPQILNPYHLAWKDGALGEDISTKPEMSIETAMHTELNPQIAPPTIATDAPKPAST